MTPILSIPAALAFPIFEGLLLIAFIEKKEPLLSHIERIAAAFLLGLSWSSFVLFLATLSGVPLTFPGFLVVHLCFIALLLFLVRFRVSHFGMRDILFPKNAPKLSLRLSSSLSTPLKVLLGLLFFWMILKILAGAYDLLLTPSYFNDTYANWNIRAKAFFTSESLLLDLPRAHRFYFGGRVPSYPLTIYFTKVWLAMIQGEWRDSVSNSVHLFWFLSLLALVFGALTRLASAVYGFLGVYILVSLPLLFLQGVNAYTDVIMSAYLFLPLLCLYQWMISGAQSGAAMNPSESQRASGSWLLLLSVSAAAMVFVKSEALLLFLPPLTLVFGIALFRSSPLKRSALEAFGTYLGTIAIIAIPWIAFKMLYGLEFGNAQGVSSFILRPNPDVPAAILGDLLYTGSFLIFFPIFLFLVLLHGRRLWRDPLFFLLVFLFIVFSGQFLIYYLTPLALEAISHTGYGRGIVQLLPSLTFVAVLLFQSIIATLIEVRSRVLPRQEEKR